jgi:glycosyltransferase involved in cell wall biosynthesis
VDGIERERKKWGRVGQFYYQLSEKLAVRWASCLVSDAQVIREYYLFWHHHDSVFIPYGFTLSSQLDLGILNEFGVQIRQYFLYVSRLEPENHAEVVIRAHALAGSSWPLLIVGTAPYARKYIQMLEGIAGPSVIFCGAVYGGRYHALQAHAFAYIQATEVGGTHPALVEAMGYGNLILANDTPENREVLGQTGFFYRRNDAADLARLMQQAARESGLRERLGHQARERARQNYDWEQVTEQYEQVFYSLIHTVASSTLPA